MVVQQEIEELFRKLVQKTEDLGRKVTFGEFAQDEGPMNANKFAFSYGSFDEAAEVAWRKAQAVHSPGTKYVPGEMGVNDMSKKKHPQLDDERKKMVLEEFVGMYIENGGQMPSSRMIKKNSYITEEEVNVLRRTGDLAETRVRRMAEQKTGQTFLSSQERRAQEARARSSQSFAEKSQNDESLQVVEPVEVTEKLEQVVEPVGKPVEPEPEVKKMRGRGHGVTEEAALEDLRALTEKLGHLPTLAEIKDPKNGAKYAYPTYVRKLGTKADWAKLLGLEVDSGQAESVAEVTEEQVEAEKSEPEVNLEAEVGQIEEAVQVESVVETEATEVVQTESVPEVAETVEVRTIEIPLKVILPKGIKGTVTLTLELD